MARHHIQNEILRQRRRMRASQGKNGKTRVDHDDSRYTDGLAETARLDSPWQRRGRESETGLRLSRALGTSERFWINIQADYDIEVEHDTHEDELNRIESLVS